MKHKALPPRLRRADSFLGIHFDFHAGDDCKEIGRHVTRRMVERIIEQVKPDYIQCDCKGHRGFSSYPTKVGYRAPGFVRDQLRIWRDVTAERGVALYLHYSGVWDSAAMKHHPSWARVDENGKRDEKNASVFGPYADKLLIPQLKELCDDYGVDGVWIDGDCWAALRDYRKEALAAFRLETGIRNIPRKPTDPHFTQFTEFCREGFRRYLRHYVDELHRHNPRFQIASNWAFSSIMPEPVSADVDFISGDYSMYDSIRTARIEARCMTRQGKPWDLMAWSFSGKWGENHWSTKSIPQLQREAAMVLSVGGGFQAYFNQKRDGSICAWHMKLMGEVAKFCRARQKVCHRAEAVPQIALLHSRAAQYRQSTKLFSHTAEGRVPVEGILNCLLDAQQAVEVLGEHHLSGRLQEYPLIVVPEWDYLEPQFIEELRGYAHGGGSLLLIGPRAAAMFAKELGVKWVGKPEEKKLWLEHDGWLGALTTLSQSVKLTGGARPFGRLHANNDLDSPSEPAAIVRPFGKGKIAATCVNLGERYRNAATFTTRRFLAALVRELFPQPLVEVTGSQFVDVVVNRVSGKLAVNLVNTAGAHADKDIYAFDEIPSVGPLAVTIRSKQKPRSVRLEPEGKRLSFTYKNGKIHLTIPRLEIHEVIVVEE